MIHINHSLGVIKSSSYSAVFASWCPFVSQSAARSYVHTVYIVHCMCAGILRRFYTLFVYRQFVYYNLASNPSSTSTSIYMYIDPAGTWLHNRFVSHC